MKKYRIRKGSLAWFVKSSITPLIFVGLVILMMFIIQLTVQAYAKECEIVDKQVPEQLKTTFNEQIKPLATKKTVKAKKVYLGKYTITAYCSCAKCCGKWALNRPKDENGKEIIYTASGEKAKSKYTIGTDWNYLPKGTKLKIKGVGTVKVQDKVADWVSERYNGKIIDLYFGSHAEALKFGKRDLKVWRLENE